MQVPQDSANFARECMKEEAETAYNLSHANIVNTLSHEMKCYSPLNTATKTKLTLYLIQVCLFNLRGHACGTCCVHALR